MSRTFNGGGRFRPTRRDVLAGAASVAAAPLLARAAPSPAPLEARPGKVQLAPEGYDATEVWGYGGTAPGPVLRAPQGGRLERRLVNGLPQATTIHWHGIRIDNAMDGVPGLTQEAVPPGAQFDYAFDLPDAGTYWYHAHERSTEQVARGLHGALIVEEPETPDVDRDEVLVLDDWLVSPETAQLDPEFESMHDRSHAGRRGNLITTNGAFAWQAEVRRHERLRLRLINASNARIFVLSVQGLEGWVMAQDGMPLEAPEPLPREIVLAPAQRVDLFVDVVAEPGAQAGLLRLDDDDTFRPQAVFSVSGAAGASRREPPRALPPNPRQAKPDLEGARRLTLNMEGGAMGGLQQAVYEGERLGFRDLARRNLFWSFNGTVGMTDAPLAELDRGEMVTLKIVNDTAFPHAMHLHGMHFRTVGADGTQGPMRDTVLSVPGEPVTLAFVADNPGDWLLHCHMLGHAASGMMTWVRVRA
ncbi:multicopper oxidase family protein [Salipiger mucosus]|uniref:Multicopper oxidase n=1 Tax=Salipiger mucosus DSM 16094 TaxID=1123237 RepID=S9QR74_9RHOB|nr:multicopper oxidase family protein [Salipiger mucosus]EPX82137.1 Multicopper oxidase [Salipiger mucosus DSM 16094]